ncbi:MAG: hypothetical protein DRP64_00110 [Verrucomicrobia bacterium]|nr:MAG: hypothetical protein DRP64_00110 [Verrucomicrobiota bacterium]
MTLLRNFGIPQRLAGRNAALKASSDKPTRRPDIYKFRAIPVPLDEDMASIVASVSALKEVVETLVGQRHDQTAAESLGKAVLHNDIYKDGARKDDAGIDNYVRKVPHVVPSIQPDPHPQYAREEAVLKFMAFSSYAGMIGQATLADIDSGWTPILNYPSESVPPRFAATDIAAGTIRVDNPGVFVLIVALSVEFADSNSGRITTIRLFNTTSGTAVGAGVPVYVGRNQDGLTTAVSLLFTVDSAGAGDSLRIEIGDGDSFSGVVLDSAAYSIFSVGPYQGEL